MRRGISDAMPNERPQAGEGGSSILGEVGVFDPIDLLQRSAAAQLRPENAQRLLRLEHLSGIVASLPPGDTKPRISAGRLRRLLEGGLGIAHLEDPFTWPFTESLAFFGGDYLVLPGLTEGLRPGIDLLLSAAMLDPELSNQTQFRNAIAHPCQALLQLSDAMCRSADLRRGQPPSEEQTLAMATGCDLERLVGALTWPDTALAALFSTTNVSPRALRAFEMPLGEAVPPGTQPGNGPLLRFPLIRFGDRLVIALPNALLTALSRFVLDVAHQFKALAPLSKAFHGLTVSRVDRCLDLMGLPPIRPDHQPKSTLPYATEQFRLLDRDMFVHVIVLSDDIATYVPSDPFGRSSYPAGGSLDDRFRAGLELAARLDEPPIEVLGLLVTSGVARTTMIGLHGGAENQEVLPIHMQELVALSYLEDDNPLYLWYFARARRRLRQFADVTAFSLGDELFFYREKDSSFYLSDERPFNGISFQPNSGGTVIGEAFRRFDPHAVRIGKRGYIECVRVYPDSSIPAYCPRFPSADEPAQCVEVDDATIWVRTRLENQGGYRLADQMAIRLVDAVTFWLSRMTNDRFVRSAAARSLAIEIHLTSPEAWRYPVVEPTGQPQDPGVSVARTDDRTVRVGFPPTSMALIGGSTGTEEQVLLRPVFRALAEAAGHSPDAADAAIARVLCSPLHRKLVPVSSDDTVAVIRRDLPPRHLIPAAAEQEVLDDVARILEDEEIPSGAIARAARTDSLKRVVGRLFELLREHLATLSPQGLLEWLIAHNEALVDELSMSRHLEPYNLACFAEDAGPGKEFADRLNELYKADQSCRFLIEYVATRPPDGTHGMSYATYDRLLALASKIVFFGTISDDIHYGSDDPDLTRLPSGRLGVGESRRRAIRDKYLAAYGSGLRARLVRVSDTSEPQSTVVRRKAAAAAIDAASATEFGFSLSQQADILDAAIRTSIEGACAVAIVPLSQFRATVASACGTSEATAAAWIEALSLQQRPDFFTPPPPATKTDVYPWRYNRLWSYVRRPFVVRGNDVLVGSSHADRAGSYLRNLCFSGRLKAVTLAMRQAIGAVTEINGHHFNRVIASMFRARSDLIVRERIDRFSGVHLATATGTLGDVDVLVAEQRTRRLLAYECKDLSIARVPPEIRNELEDLSVGDKSIIAKHQRRVDWLRGHVDLVLGELGIARRGRWTVEGAVIVDEELVGSFLLELPMKILSIAEVEKMLKVPGAVL